MKFRRKVLSVALLFLATVTHAQSLRLYHYSDDNTNYFSYPSASYDGFVERFDLTEDIRVIRVELLLDGPSGSTGKLHFLGHEGGTSFPQFESPVSTTYSFRKSSDGKEKVVVSIDEDLVFKNDQFFLVVSGLSSGLNLLSSSEIRQTVCSSSSGGDYYNQLLINRSGNYAFGSRRGFIVDVIAEPISYPTTYLFEALVGSGIDSTRSNATMAWADIDKNGYADLMVAGKLYLNNGDKTFTDVTDTYGLDGSANSNALVDLDNDGDLDIINLRNNSSSALFKNTDTGFVRIPLDYLPAFRSISSLSFGDIDGDGYLDMFVGQLWGAYPEPQPNYLFRNIGNLKFADETQRVYPQYDGNSNYPSKVKCSASDQNTWLSGGNQNRRSRGSMFVDYDQDGDPDLYVTNYFLEKDEFYQNDGKGNFTNIVNAAGIDKNATSSNHGTGVDWADYDNDGDEDLLLPQFAHPGFTKQYNHRATTVYNNPGQEPYLFVNTNPDGKWIDPPNGIEFEETYAGGTWGDFNNDGLLDFYITVFYGCRYAKLYIQNPDHTYSLAPNNGDLVKLNTGQDAVWVDIDNDGDLDLSTGRGNRIMIAENKNQINAHWVQIDLLKKDGTIPVGARIKVTTSSGTFTRSVSAGRGVRMQSPYTQHFGLGNDEVIRTIEVHWNDSNQTITTWNNVLADKKYTIVAGSKAPENKENVLNVFPNPAQNKITVRWKLTAADIDQDVKVCLLDVTGREVFTFYTAKNGSGNDHTVAASANFSQVEPGIYQITAPVSGLYPGVYIVDFQHAGRSESAKLMITRP